MNGRIFDDDFMEEFRNYDGPRFAPCESCEGLVELGSDDHVLASPGDSANLCKNCAADEWLFRCPHCGEIMKLDGSECQPEPDLFVIDQALICGKIHCPLCEEWVGLDLFHVDMISRLKRARRVVDLRRKGSLYLAQAERQAAREFELKKEDLG